ncbi:MAG: SH3 domain-containing protein [Spirochaetales bacterium]|nr:SH3 domain-containing protein [Spirochaetales bacterium]
MKIRHILIILLSLFIISCGGSTEKPAADTTSQDLSSPEVTDTVEATASEAVDSTDLSIVDGEGAEDILDAAPNPLAGRCDTDRLNIRNGAGGDGDIVGLLLQDDAFLALEKTSWTEKIDGYDAPWVRIETDKYEGWVFGGYLAMDIGSFDAVLDSDLLPPAPPVPEKTYSVKSMNMPTGFGVDVSFFPVFTAHATEIIDPLMVEPGVDQLFISEGLSVSLVSTHGLKPEKSVKIKAVDPRGKDYEFDYSFAANDVRWMTESDTDGMSYVIKTPSLVFKYPPYAFYERGEWFFRFFFDGQSTEAFHGTVDMKSQPITIAGKASPAPQDIQPGRTMEFSPGDTIYFWANLSGYDSATFIIYNRDESRADMVRNPVYGSFFSPDEEGMYSDEIIIGKDLPPGNYNIAYSLDKGHLELYPIMYRFKVVE